MNNLTLIVPFYRNCAMLQRQVIEWNDYPPGLQIIVVDDGSPEPALPIVLEHATDTLRERLQVYRIEVDIPWNREGARNLGAHVAMSEWILHVDIDHLLPTAAVRPLLEFSAYAGCWYRFPRWRVGKADETRQKDKIDPDVTYGEIHPHIDSYLVERAVYWDIGGYDEDFAGCLGGGTEFLRRLSQRAQLKMMPSRIRLHVYTRSEIKDASDWSLSRDRQEGKRREKFKARSGNDKPVKPLRFTWSRQL